MIEINVDTESEIATYDRYLSQLLENDLKITEMSDVPSSPTTISTSTGTLKDENNIENEIFDLEKTFDDESKWTCLLQYEEEERINKLITTTTTRTITEDILCYDRLKDNNSRFCLNDSTGDELDETFEHHQNNSKNSEKTQSQ